MTARISGCITTAFCLSLLAQQPAPQPTFRSGIDVVRVDVTVLDGSRRPVRALTQQDFTILVDGVPQPIVAFEPVEIPAVEPPTAQWMREVSPDVRTNALGEPRLFIIIMDDATTNAIPFMVNTAKAVAHRIIDEMHPSDLAAVVFTMDNSAAQDLTSDRRLLRAAVEHFNFGFSGNPLAVRYSQRTLQKAMDFLRQRGQGRNAIMLLSSRPAGARDFGDRLPSLLGSDENDLLSYAERYAPVPIYGFNIAGLVAPNGVTQNRSGIPGPDMPYTEASAKGANETFLTLANVTGGRAVVDHNQPAIEVPEIFQEMSAYYTLGYRATYPTRDGKRRRMEIKVAREHVTILPSDRVLSTERPRREKETPGPLLKAVSDIVPASDLPMAVSVVPIAMPRDARGRGPGSGLLMTVRLRRVAPPERGNDTIEVLAKVFTPEGVHVVSAQQNTALKLRAADRDAQMDVLTPIAVKPGRYNVRISAHSAALGKTGSVYADVIVPDFGRDRLSMSGLMVTANPAPVAAPVEAFRQLIPVVPTTERDFVTDQRVGVFARIYQAKSPIPVTVTTRLLDGRGTEVAAGTERLTEFTAGRSADFTYHVPVGTLTPGSYLLSLRAVLDEKSTVTRELRFTVR